MKTALRVIGWILVIGAVVIALAYVGITATDVKLAFSTLWEAAWSLLPSEGQPAVPAPAPVPAQ